MTTPAKVGDGNPNVPERLPPRDGPLTALIQATGERTPYALAWSAVGSVVGTLGSITLDVSTFPATLGGPLGASLFGALAVLGVFSRYKDERRRQFAAELQDLNKMFHEGLLTKGELRELRAAAKKKYAGGSKYESRITARREHWFLSTGE